MGITFTSIETKTEVDGDKREFALIKWHTCEGAEIGQIMLPFSGNGTLGPKFDLPLAAIHKSGPFDTREWQWWENYPYVFDEKRPRLFAPSIGCINRSDNKVQVKLTYNCDNVETTQMWLFEDQQNEDKLHYDVVIKIKNLMDEPLNDYGQFFACYADWNESKGHFYLNSKSELINYADKGSTHLDYYVCAPNSYFSNIGNIPHCPRGEGKIKDHWSLPISISQCTKNNYWHLVMSEASRTSSITQGMKGIAQDYLLSPPDNSLKPGESFTSHIRHLITKEWRESLLDEWGYFERAHEEYHSYLNDC